MAESIEQQAAKLASLCGQDIINGKSPAPRIAEALRTAMASATRLAVAGEEIGLSTADPDRLQAALERIAARPCGCRMGPGEHAKGCTVYIAAKALLEE